MYEIKSMAEKNKGKAAIISILSLLIEPYRFSRREIDKKRIKRLFYSILISLVFIIIITVPDEIFNPNPTPIFLAIVRVLLTITFLLSITLIIVVNDTKISRNYLILIAWMVLAFTFKRFQFPTAGLLIVSSLSILALGNFILCVKFLIQIDNNKYLRIIGAIGAFIIGCFALAVVTKYQHWPGSGLLQTISLGPMLLLTFIILATLPNSSFINWNKKHKEILTKRLLIPWVFLLIFTALRMLLPAEISNKIFYKDSTTIEPFYMNDFHAESREGLEKEANK
jgi:hypothetical protein